MTNQDYIKYLYAFLESYKLVTKFDRYLAQAKRECKDNDILNTVIDTYGAEYLINCIAPISQPTAKTYNQWDVMSWEWMQIVYLIDIETTIDVVDNISKVDEIHRYVRLVRKHKTNK